MTHQSKVLALVGLLVVAATVAQVAAQNNKDTDELRLRGDQQQQQQQQGGGSASDTTIISDENTIPSSNNRDNQMNNPLSDEGENSRPRPPPSSPLGFRLPSFFRGDSASGPGLFGSLFGGPPGLMDPMQPNQGRPYLFDTIFDTINRQRENLDREFSNLERQAGEGQEVTDFYRNGIAYRRTCTTHRLSPNDQQQQQQPPSGSRAIPEEKRIGQLEVPKDNQTPSQPQQQLPAPQTV